VPFLIDGAGNGWVEACSGPNSVDSVPSSLLGMLMVHEQVCMQCGHLYPTWYAMLTLVCAVPQARTVGDVIGVPPDDIRGTAGDGQASSTGYGTQCIQRWFQAEIVSSGTAVGDGGAFDSAYEEVVRRFMFCLAGAVLGNAAACVLSV
jgi:hypothetical protein